MELKKLDRTKIYMKHLWRMTTTITFSVFDLDDYYESNPTLEEIKKLPLKVDKETGHLFLEPKKKLLSPKQKKERLDEENRQLKKVFGGDMISNYRKLCESMVSDYPDDFYMYEEYLVYIHYLFLFEDVSSYLEQFDDDLKNKVLDFYRKNIPKMDLLSFME